MRIALKTVSANTLEADKTEVDLALMQAVIANPDILKPIVTGVEHMRIIKTVIDY